ncbi:hypothetical protein W822_05675 [Advenella kashmirensis W13003]|uniref:Pentapeptide MXKDX repeat protein n=1 Tax=Advenella kashmirensis W13003 TaxID=1424334 RepID=V8QX87_9BURK|nr:hypothetical protein [Advenella kashmirensis]ETF03624.1 hypothetical protein W822_05675 [Advenella kashmirensis W13003]
MKILTHSAVAMCLIFGAGSALAADVTNKENTQESMSDDSKLDEAPPVNKMPGNSMDKSSTSGSSMSHESEPKESMSNDSKPKEGVSNDSKGDMKN